MKERRIKRLFEELGEITKELGEQAPLDSFYSGYRLSMQRTNVPYQPYHSPVDFSIFQAFKNVSTLSDVLAARLEDLERRIDDTNVKREIDKVVEALHSIKEDADEILKKEKVKKEGDEILDKEKIKKEDDEEGERKEAIRKKIKEWRERRAGSRLYEGRYRRSGSEHLKEDLVNMVEDLIKATDFYTKIKSVA